MIKSPDLFFLKLFLKTLLTFALHKGITYQTSNKNKLKGESTEYSGLIFV